MNLRSGLVAAAFAAAPFVLVGACSSPTAQPPITGDHPPWTQPTVGRDGGVEGSVQDAFTWDTSWDDAGACTQLQLVGGYVLEDYLQQDPPVMTGGTLLDGIYVMTAAHDYVGVNGTPGSVKNYIKETWVFAGSTARVTVDVQGTGAPVTEAYTFVITTGDGGAPNTVIDLTLTCSTNPQAVTRSQLGYTVSGSSLTILGGNVSNVLAKQ